MKKSLIVLFVALMIPMAARAQSAAPGQIAADAQLALPLGNFGDVAGIGFGVLGRYERNVMPKLNVTGRVGLVYHLSKDVNGLGGSVKTTYYAIPLLVGAKYDLTEAIYAAAEFGIFNNHFSSSFGGVSGSSSETDAGLTLGAGYRMGEMDIRIALEMVNLSHAGDSMVLVGGFGWTFWRG